MIDWQSSAPLLSLTHLDGRNAHKVLALRPYFSEFAWMKLRLGVIFSYVQSVSKQLTYKAPSPGERKKLQSITDTFSLKDAQAVIAYERKVNHDLKALEMFAASRLKRRGLLWLIPFINLGLGSEDINSMALGIALTQSRGEVIVPALTHVMQSLSLLCEQEKDTVMVARTHAQPANVTTFGKEVSNSLSRLCDEVERFKSIVLSAKCTGEVGSLQAFNGMGKKLNWLGFTDAFVQTLGLIPTHAGTQIAPYDHLIKYFQSLFCINSILIDFSKNMWLYLLLGYIRVKKVDHEVGSAGMPHKVNPIYFEGAEGGLAMANGIIETLVRTLPVNRLQRDFSDSTLRRNIVLPLAYSFLSYQSLAEALSRIEVDRGQITRDVQNHAEIWLETVKSYSLLHGIQDIYDRLKEKTRGRVLSQEDLSLVIAALPLKAKEKAELGTLCKAGRNPYPARIVEEVITKAL